MHSDSLDKLFFTYLAAVCDEEVSYRGRTVYPKDLRVSDGLFRGFTCPSHCGGCCFAVSLDFLPSEIRPVGGCISPTPRRVVVNGYEKMVISDLQEDNSDRYCKFLNRENGRCRIHGLHPFGCDFPFIRFTTYQDPKRANQLNQQLFGRGWALKTVKGRKGAQCSITPVSESSVQDVIRKLKRLQDWADYFKIRTCLPMIIEFAEKGPAWFPLVLRFTGGTRRIPSMPPQRTFL